MLGATCGHVPNWPKQSLIAIHIDVGYQGVFGDSRVVSKIIGAKQSLFLSCHRHKEDGAARTWIHPAVGPRNLQQACRGGSVIQGAVVDSVAVHRLTDAEMIQMRGVDDVFLSQYRITAA